jgi:hypothetical protein
LVKAAGLGPTTEKKAKVQAALNYESVHTLTRENFSFTPEFRRLTALRQYAP